ELTLGIIRIQFTKRVAQYLAIKSKNAGVDFVNGALRVVGIFVLNNRGDLARFVADDSSISSRIRKLDAQHRDSIAVVDVGSTELIDGLRAQYRHICIGHDDRAFKTFDRRESAANSMASAILLSLDGLSDIALQVTCNRINGWAYLVTLVTNDRDDVLWTEICCGLQ